MALALETIDGVRPRGRPQLSYMNTIRRYTCEEELADGRQHS